MYKVVKNDFGIEEVIFISDSLKEAQKCVDSHGGIIKPLN